MMIDVDMDDDRIEVKNAADDYESEEPEKENPITPFVDLKGKGPLHPESTLKNRNLERS